MKRIAIALFLIPETAAAKPALEWEARYVNQHIPFAGRRFEYTSSRVNQSIDGSAFGLGYESLHGGEMSFFGRGDVWAFGPMVGFAMGNAPSSPWTGAAMKVFHVNVALEGRYTFSIDRLTGWVGGALGMAVTNVTSGPETNRALVRDYPRSASRIDLLLQPRLGVEYAFTQGMYGRCAVGAWMGVDPLQQSWAWGLLLSTRLNLIAPQGTTQVYF